MFKYIINIFNVKISNYPVKETPYSKEFRHSYNKNWINEIKNCNFLI